MALKDWKKVTGGWQNKKNKTEVFIVSEEWRRFEKVFYNVIIVENGKPERQYDNALTSRSEALQSVKQYMRTH